MAQQVALSEEPEKLNSIKQKEEGMQALEDVLVEIENRFRINFAYEEKSLQDKFIDNDKLSWIHEEKKSGEEIDINKALNNILEPLNLKFKKINQNVFVIQEGFNSNLNHIEPLKPRDLYKVQNRGNGKSNYENNDQLKSVLNNETSKFHISYQDFTVSGRVTSQDGDPLPGVNVVVLGTSEGTVTDVNGNYTITASEQGTLVYSFVGYESRQESINGRSQINISLKESLSELEEVVVVGYGTQQKKSLTGSVMSVSSEDFESQPITKIDQALQGKVAGVQITQNSGYAGSDFKIRVRGPNSISGNNSPLYVVDGMFFSDISSINIADVESIEILKDASATAIYGSRGSNGVVLINTKKGREQKTTINFDAFYGSSNIVQKLPMMEPHVYAEQINEYEGEEIFSQEEISDLRTSGGVDWQEELFRTSPSQNYHLSARGGTESSNYYLSGGYYDAKGTIIDRKYHRYTFRANYNADFSDNVRVGVNAFAAREGKIGQRANLSNGLTYDMTTPIYNDEGEINQTSEKAGVGTGDNNPMIFPLFHIRDRFENKIVSNGDFEVDILENLVLNVSGGVEWLNNNTSTYVPLTVNPQGRAGVNLQERATLLNTNRLTYTYDEVGNHNLKIDLINEQIKNTNTYINTSGQGFFSDATTYKDLSLAELPSINNGETSSTLRSYLGRVNYSFDQKYFITASIRADGSSKFRPGQKWGVFPSGAVAWTISEEGFMQNVNWLSNLKIRSSYGITGSQAIGPLATRLKPVTGKLQNYPYTGDAASIGFVPSGQQVNPNLTWEETAQANFGLDLSVMEGMATFSFDAYQKKTTNLLLNRRLPRFVGPTQITQNVGAVENQGYEFSFGITPLNTADWTFNSNLTFSRNVNTVVELVDDEPLVKGNERYLGQFLPTAPTRLEVGEPMSMFRGYEYRGVYQSDEAAEAAEMGRQPGDAKYADLNGDGQITPDGDLTKVGTGYPDFTFGWNSNLTFKNFNLNFLFTGSVGNDIYNFQKARMMGLGSRTFHATYKTYQNHWTPDNPSDIPARRDGWRALSSQFVENGSYFTLKNINLSYTFDNLLQTIGMERLEVYGSIDNAFILTNYTGFDPETTATGNSDVEVGVDINTYPLARTFTFGAKLNF